jgi:hypothetical protein
MLVIISVRGRVCSVVRAHTMMLGPLPILPVLHVMQVSASRTSVRQAYLKHSFGPQPVCY